MLSGSAATACGARNAEAKSELPVAIVKDAEQTERADKQAISALDKGGVDVTS